MPKEPWPVVRTSEYSYNLPEDRIAQFPLEEREHSKLLIYRDGVIRHARFDQLDNFLPAGATLVFNNTRVISARIFFSKSTGASIEVFLLDPWEPAEISQSLGAHSPTTWKCLVGNKKKWKSEQELEYSMGTWKVKATWADREQNLIRFSWSQRMTFSEVLESIGKLPLPPYILRQTEETDSERYQTVYSRIQGAVAAPTAGLHFSDELLERLSRSGFSSRFVTLHVSAGTFRPIKSSNAMDHPMHNERIEADRALLESLCDDRPVIAVGTTSMRTLESIYWFGCQLEHNPKSEFKVERLEPYAGGRKHLSLKDAVGNVIQYMDQRRLPMLRGNSEIFIVPGYRFKVCQGLITNFHLPASSLLLLVAAWVGKDWKKIYLEALDNQYRFLSYGDSSLLYPIGQKSDWDYSSSER